jgi:cardiolipin synthase
MPPPTVLTDVLDALHHDRSLRRFFSLLWRFGRETAAGNHALRRSFFRTALGLALLTGALDGLLWWLSPGEGALLITLSGAFWLAAVLLVTFFQLGLFCTEDGRPLLRLGLPNELTLARIALMPPVFNLVVRHDEFPELRTSLIVAFALLAVSDVLDGFLARRLRLESVFGRVVDPVSDMLFNSMVALSLTLAGALPWWLLLLVWARYFVPLVGGYYLFLTRGPFRIHATGVGKASGFVLGVLLGGSLIERFHPGTFPPWLLSGLLWTCTALLVVNVGYALVVGVRTARN